MPTKVTNTFAARLTALREARGWTVYRLAKLTGLTASTVHNLEAGSDPGWKTVQALADALGCSVEEFRR
jgi:transcriptional regulator with XRE-family HTH domain